MNFLLDALAGVQPKADFAAEAAAEAPSLTLDSPHFSACKKLLLPLLVEPQKLKTGALGLTPKRRRRENRGQRPLINRRRTFHAYVLHMPYRAESRLGAPCER
jgi:hypothetical protein